jgi:hypothetical protein
MQWFDTIKDAIKDTVTLDVVTTNGKITMTAAEMEDTNWEQLADKVSEKIKSAEINVVAYTHSQWDCDSFMFVQEGLPETEKMLLESHAATVNAAHATRREAVKMVANLIKGN